MFGEVLHKLVTRKKLQQSLPETLAATKKHIKKKGQGNRKNGNRYLALAFVQAAHLAAIWEPKIKSFYQRKQSKSHIMVAKKAVAAKLARANYHMLNEKEPFDVNRAFG